jgi:TolB-like protein/tetratricopeptide (TPR) repeat protein
MVISWSDRLRNSGAVKEFPPFQLDAEDQRLWRNGQPVTLAPKAFAVLQYLVDHAGRLVTQNDLLEAVWADTFVQPEVLKSQILDIRSALGDDAKNPSFIETQPRRGYRFIATVRESCPTGAVPKSRADLTPAQLTESGSAGSIAVLPLIHQGSNPDDEYFADGLADELITALSHVPGLKVVARTSSFAFKGLSPDAREIGRTLKVESVLEGSVRRNKDRLRIHVQLIDTNDGCQLWAQKYERRIADVFELQDEIASGIVDALKVEIPRARRPGLARRTSNPQAHELYLKGRFWWHHWSPEALRKAAVFFEEAIECDPLYAPPYSGLADCHFLLGYTGYGRPRDLMPRALAAARKGLEIDPLLAEAHCSLALIENAWGWDSARCQAEFLRCLDLNPGYALAIAKYGTAYLSPLCRFEESFEWISRAVELDPLSPNVHSDLALNYAYRREYDRFEREAARVLEMGPGVWKLYWIQIGTRVLRGDRPGALAACECALGAAPEDPMLLSSAVWAYARLGEDGRATELCGRLDRLASSRYVPFATLAIAQNGFGNTDAAFALLERALEERDPLLRVIRQLPPLHQLHSDPRYAALLRKVGLNE